MIKTLVAGPRSPRHANDLYPTPHSIIDAVAARVVLPDNIWEPFAGDLRFAEALEQRGCNVITGDIATGEDFFAITQAPALALFSNPPFDQVRQVIDHAFAIGVQTMCLVLPERLWACGLGAVQFERHKPLIWVNLSWREDYLGRGGSADRALAVAIWDAPHHQICSYEIWTPENGKVKP